MNLFTEPTVRAQPVYLFRLGSPNTIFLRDGEMDIWGVIDSLYISIGNICSG